MNKGTTLLKVILGIAAILYMGIQYLDWSRLFLSPGSDLTELLLSRILKLSISGIMLLVAWNIASDPFDNRDKQYMRIVFVFIFISDIFFFSKLDIFGMGLFFLIQILFIGRNSRGIKSFLKNDARKHALRLLCTFLIPLFVFLAIYIVFLWPLMKQETVLFTCVGVYGLLSCVSVGTGFISLLIKYFPVRNSMFIITGLLCLYCGDIAVGFSLGFALHQIKDLYYILSTSITWFFYAPMLLCMGLSTKKFDNKNF